MLIDFLPILLKLKYLLIIQSHTVNSLFLLVQKIPDLQTSLHIYKNNQLQQTIKILTLSLRWVFSTPSLTGGGGGGGLYRSPPSLISLINYRLT